MEAAFLVLAVLAASLEDDRFVVRQAASRGLETQPLVHMLFAARPMGFGPESRSRQNAIWSTFREYRAKHLTDKLFPTGRKVLPWIDSLPDDFPDGHLIYEFVREVHLEVPAGTSNSPDFPTYRLATRKLIGALLRGGWEPDRVVELLDQMVEKEDFIVAQTKAAEEARLAEAARIAAQKPEEP